MTMLAGQYKFSSYLKPGESARTPLLAFVEYEGGEDAATNAWRHWFIDCNMARAGEKQEVIPTMIVSSSMSSGVTTPVVKLKMAEFYRHGINLDAFWLDAGWYTGIGTEPVALAPDRFPADGCQPIPGPDGGHHQNSAFPERGADPVV